MHSNFPDKIKLTPGKKYKRIFKQNCWAWMHNLDSNAMNSIVEKVKSFYFGDKKIYSPSAAVRVRKWGSLHHLLKMSENIEIA